MTITDLAKIIASLFAFYGLIVMVEAAYFAMDGGIPLLSFLYYFSWPIITIFAPIAVASLVSASLAAAVVARALVAQRVILISSLLTLVVVSIASVSYLAIVAPTSAGLWAGIRLAAFFDVLFLLPVLILNWQVVRWLEAFRRA